MSKLIKQTKIGKKIILEDNISRQKLQSENEKLEAELLLEEKELSEISIQNMRTSENYSNGTRPERTKFDC